MSFRQVTTTCPYCGTGCSLNLQVQDNRVIGTAPYFRSPVNEGKICPKGTYCHQFIHSPERLKRPLIRRGDVFVESDWEAAYDLIASRLKKFKPDEIAVLSSARCTTEENYLTMKFTRGLLKSRHIDHCARLCHSSTMVGLTMAFGNGAMTNSIEDISASDCIVCIGSNTFEQHPLIGRQILKAKAAGAKFIYADPRFTPTAMESDLFLQFYSGSDVAVLNCIMGEIIRNGWEDTEFISTRTRDFDLLKKTVLLRRYEPDPVSLISGVSAADLKTAAEWIGKAKACTVLYAMGITQHVIGVNNVRSVANLMMLTGNIGRPGTGVNALRGQNNVQGASDVGCLPNVFPGYQSVTDGAVLRKFAHFWKFPDGICEPRTGTEITTIFENLKAKRKDIRAMYLIGENPLVSEPDLTSVEDAIVNLDFLVVQDIFFTETCQYADVVLPAACFAEKDGTQTNTERRVQRIRKAIEPPGDAKPDWQIICELARYMGYGEQFPYTSVEEIFQEITEVTPQYHGMTYERVSRPEGVCWPCPEKRHPGTKILYTEEFLNTDTKGVFSPAEWREPSEMPDKKYPYRFTTGRIIWHWHTGTMTRRCKNLTDEVNEAYIEMNAGDAEDLDIKDGEMVRVTSRRGSLVCRSKVVRDIKRGVMFMPFHFAEAAANRLTSNALDPLSKIPEYKVAAVMVKRCEDET